jgi:hypothetical protein
LLSFSIEPNFNQVNNLKLEPVLLPFIWYSCKGFCWQM